MPRTRKKGIKGNGSVFQRSDGRWVAQITVEENGKQRQLYGATEKEVNEKLQKALQEQRLGILATGPKQKLSEYLNWWLDEVHKVKIRPHTYRGYRSALDIHILPELGNIQLGKLSTKQVQAFYNKKLQTNLSPSSLHVIHNVLNGALKRAVRLRYISYNPAAETSLPANKPIKDSQSLTLEQARHLLKVAQGHRLEVFIALVITTGMRHGELQGLQWSDITFEAGTIFVRRTTDYVPGEGFFDGPTKTEAGERTVLLVPAVRPLLEAHRRLQIEQKSKAGDKWKENDLVFCNEFGRNWHAASTRRSFYRLIKKANATPDEAGRALKIPFVHIHELRHTASTLWQDIGVNDKVVQEMMGHSHLETTKNIYTHVLPSMRKEALEKINTLLEGPL